jgi:hypothetical protein
MFDRGSEGWIEFLAELGQLGRQAFLDAAAVDKAGAKGAGKGGKAGGAAAAKGGGGGHEEL